MNPYLAKVLLPERLTLVYFRVGRWPFTSLHLSVYLSLALSQYPNFPFRSQPGRRMKIKKKSKITHSTLKTAFSFLFYVCPIALFTHFVVLFVFCLFFPPSREVNKIPLLRAHTYTQNFSLNSRARSRSECVCVYLLFLHTYISLLLSLPFIYLSL